jgi:nicotinate-nucleotide adenylyltransferase
MIRSRIYPLSFPPAAPGMTIGLYGGSFNPPHEGHRHVALSALRRLKLDRLWCLVTPGNPLKDHAELAGMAQRLEATARLMDHPRIDITGIEQKAGTRFTAESLDWIRTRRPRLRFVWIMGADNLNQFHKWQRWQDILRKNPVAIIDRPGYSLSPLRAPAAQHFASARIKEHEAATLARHDRPAWVFLTGPRSELSSTQLRNQG